MSEEPARVECYSGHTYAQEPRAFVWQGQRYIVRTVEWAWRTPQGPCFRVRTEDDGRFELIYKEADERWAISLLMSEEE
jgi:hypothetical protein